MTDEEVAKLISTIELKSMFYGADEMWGKALQLIWELQTENAALRERLEKSIELPFFQEDGEARILVYRDKNGIVCTEIYFEDEIYWGRYGDEAAEARLAELKEEK